jgi:hypothetical protein
MSVISWMNKRSAWQEMEYHRARRAQFLKEDQANMDAVNSAMATALQTKISAASNNAAKAALKRVEAATKANTAKTTQQIDDTLKLLDKTKANLDSTTTPAATSTPSVVDTLA